MFFAVVVLLLSHCDAVTEMTAFSLVSYDGLSCPQTDVLFLKTDVRSRIECVTRCTEVSDCACIFYKQGYCQGCQGLCHHGHYGAPLPALAETVYYYMNKMPRISSLVGSFSYANNFYLTVETADSWQNALVYCNNLLATLLYVTTQEELDFIATQLASPYYWSGGILSAGQYVWSHNGASINMTMFYPGEPSSNASCVGMWSTYNYVLEDGDCNAACSFICKSF